jgi:hypothetical protein
VSLEKLEELFQWIHCPFCEISSNVWRGENFEHLSLKIAQFPWVIELLFEDRSWANSTMSTETHFDVDIPVGAPHNLQCPKLFLGSLARKGWRWLTPLPSLWTWRCSRHFLFPGSPFCKASQIYKQSLVQFKSRTVLYIICFPPFIDWLMPHKRNSYRKRKLYFSFSSLLTHWWNSNTQHTRCLTWNDLRQRNWPADPFWIWFLLPS